MDAMSRIELTLTGAVAQADAAGAPPRLAAAMHDSVFPEVPAFAHACVWRWPPPAARMRRH